MSKKPTPSKKAPLVILALILLATPAVFNRFYEIKLLKRDNRSSSSPSTSQNLAADTPAITGCSIADEINQNANYQLADLSDTDLAAARSFLKFRQVRADFIPSGVPPIYGSELNISFDQVQDAIDKVRVYGPTYGQDDKKITLTGADLERYKQIGASIACEYCCGVKTLTKPDGTAACGCAHSIMMRGLTAYLIKNHPEISNAQILDELNRWKITYFPKQTLSAKLDQLEKSGEPGIKEILQEFPDFLPQMVGGC